MKDKDILSYTKCTSVGTKSICMGHLVPDNKMSTILRFGPGEIRSTSAGYNVHKAANAAANFPRDSHGPAYFCASANARAAATGIFLFANQLRQVCSLRVTGGGFWPLKVYEHIGGRCDVASKGMQNRLIISRSSTDPGVFLRADAASYAMTKCVGSKHSI